MVDLITPRNLAKYHYDASQLWASSAAPKLMHLGFALLVIWQTGTRRQREEALRLLNTKPFGGDATQDLGAPPA